MASNKNGREKLEQIYGKGCMFKKAKVEEQIEQLKTIKTYKKFLKETRYNGKKIRLLEKNMTYHHLRHRSEGGKTTNDNGAIINELAHRYIHTLSRKEEEVVNNILRHYKMLSGTLMAGEGKVELQNPFQVDLNFTSNEDYAIILAYDNSPEDYLLKEKRKYNRIQEKRKTQELIEEYEKENGLEL